MGPNRETFSGFDPDEMAAKLGTTREQVSRILNRFADEGLIHITRTELKSPDRMAWRAWQRNNTGTRYLARTNRPATVAADDAFRQAKTAAWVRRKGESLLRILLTCPLTVFSLSTQPLGNRSIGKPFGN
jgi:hypothetical protein